MFKTNGKNSKRRVFRKGLRVVYFISIVLLFVSLGLVIFKPKPKTEAEAGWYNDNYRYRRRIPITYTGTETLIEYQVLVQGIDTSTLITNSKMQSDCDDIRFTSENGEILDFYLIPYTCNTTSTQLWVKTAKIAGPNPVNIFMYYGNPTATSESDIDATFSYSSEKTVGYVMDPTVDDLNIISLSDNNSITHNGTTVNLDYGKLDTTTFSTGGTTVSQWGAISAKGLFNADDNSENTDLFVPVSWAGTEFNYWLRAPNGNADAVFYFLAPWSTVSDQATVTVYQGGVSAGTHAVYGSTGASGAYVGVGNQGDASRDFRISSTRPILLFVRAYLASNHANIMPIHPNTTQKWIGSGGTSLIMNGNASLNYGYYRNGSASEATGTVAVNDESTAFTGSGNYGQQAFLVRSTNGVYSFGVQQHDDNDGPMESHYYNDVTEQGTRFGSANQADYISIASTHAATCSLYHYNVSGVPSLLSSGTLTSSNTQIYHYGFNTNSTATYTSTYGWFMECDKPVVAYYQKATVTEANLMSHVMMRQFTYPTPAVGTIATEEKGPAPAGYWKMDEGSDNLCSGGSNDVCDSMGSLNDGVLSGAVWQTASACVSGRCLLFDGTDDYVSVAANTKINLNSQTGYSVCAWFNADSDGEGDAGEFWAKGNSYLRVDSQSASTIKVSALLDLATADASYTTTNTFPINQWNHACVTWEDDADDELTLYVNGILQGSSTNGNGSPAADTASTMYFGGDSSNNFDGYIDDIKVYTYARNASEILAEYNSGLSGSGSAKGVSAGLGAIDTDGTYLDEALQAEWDFETGGGDSLGDSSPNSNVGDLAGSGTTCPTGSSACPSWTSNSVYGKALDFDGSDDYVQVSANSTIDFNSKTGYSICSWVNPDSDGEGDAGKFWAKGNSYIRTASESGGAVYVEALLELATSDASYTSTITIPTNSWSHVCVTWADDADDELSLYIEGNYIGSSSNGNGSPTNDSASDLYIGGDSSNNFDGEIDDLKVYNVELTANEVKIAKNNSKGVALGSFSTESDGKTTTYDNERSYCVPGDTNTCNAPVAEYKFDENTGTSTVYDSSGNGYNGTMSGSMTVEDWVAGMQGQALDFDNSDDFIDIGAGPGTVNSVSFWVYPRSTTEYFVDLNGSAYIWANAGALTATGFTTPSYYVNGKSGTTITANTWQFITVTTGTSVNASDLDIGRLEGTDYFNGIIDNVVFYNYARSLAQAAWEYDRGKPFAFYKFEECEGATIYDTQGTKNGTLTIGASGGQTSIGTCFGSSTEAWYNSTSGKYNRGISLDGTDDYVDVGNTGSTLRSVSLWVKPDTTTEDVIDFDGGTHYISISSSAVSAGGFSSPTIYIDGIQTTTLPDITNWHHITVVTSTGFSASDVDIGRLSSSYYDGKIDHVRFFNYPLTQVQMLMEYNQGSAVRIGPASGNP